MIDNGTNNVPQPPYSSSAAPTYEKVLWVAGFIIATNVFVLIKGVQEMMSGEGSLYLLLAIPYAFITSIVTFIVVAPVLMFWKTKKQLRITVLILGLFMIADIFLNFSH